MASEPNIARYRASYACLIRLYPKAFRERFGDGLTQTFNDLCRERRELGEGVFAFVVGLFLETSIGVIRERGGMMFNQNKRLFGVLGVIVLLLMIPLIAMQFTDEVNWGLADFVVMGGLLLCVGLAFELVARQSASMLYRIACGVGIVTVFLLFWVNGAVGIIGNEGQPANLLYGAVIAVGLVGAVMSRFRPSGMAYTLFAAALTQTMIPVLALILWPHLSWGSAGMFRVFCFNGFFVLLFVVSGFLFHRASTSELNQNIHLKA